MTHHNKRSTGRIITVASIHLFVLTVLLSVHENISCDKKFEGFGVFLGSNPHFSLSQPGTEAKVLEIVYNFLGIRYFRTSIEENFSPEQDKYEITCTEDNKATCSWINVHKYVANLTGVKVFASVWSPPHYMKNNFYQLMPEFETEYLYFLKNITHLIERDYNITIEKISPVNEPENVFAPWDHTNMLPEQLCRIIRNYNDPLISLCPENSYFWVSKIYYDFDSGDPSLNCSAFCSVQASHSYALNLNFSSDNSFLAYYDLKPYNNTGGTVPIWMTEVSSTYYNAETTQMNEGLDMATNIINFLSVTCVQRYYFWYAYTLKPSGESLIWGDENGNLIFPKKFFIYKLFVNASNTISGPVEVNNCGNTSSLYTSATTTQVLGCIQFGDKDRVLVNNEADVKPLEEFECSSLCCTTEIEDFSCVYSTDIHSVPPRSVCHCILDIPIVLNNSIVL